MVKKCQSKPRVLPIFNEAGSVLTRHPAATFQVGVAVGRQFKRGVIALRGDLGAGKTIFAKGVAQGLGVPRVQREVTSPTFTLIHEHEGKVPFYHVDLYRIHSEDEALSLDLKRYFYADAVTLVEWPERCESWLPVNRLEVAIEILSSQRRRIRISGRRISLVRAVTTRRSSRGIAGMPS